MADPELFQESHMYRNKFRAYKSVNCWHLVFLCYNLNPARSSHSFHVPVT